MCSKVELHIQTSGNNGWIRTSGKLEKCNLIQNIAHPVCFSLVQSQSLDSATELLSVEAEF